ncbi:MAG TPA: molybdopterin-binding protein [Candidatus Limnocylindrales bacterium]|nr:molybdopterin-binding protein [Candidatus Limnocylindrales bacterium]
MRLERLTPGRRPPAELVGAVLARDLVVGGSRWSKGRRLSVADLAAWAVDPSLGVGPVTVIVLDEGDLHEDDAALRLADAVAGSGLTRRGPSQSRVDLLAEHDGVLHVRATELERLNRIDPLEVFTRLDGSIVAAGDLVASVKVAPHVVPASVVEAGEQVVAGGRRPLVRVAPFRPMRVGVIVKESLRAADRPRFEASVRVKVESLGSTIVGIEYVGDEDGAVLAALSRQVRGRAGSAVDVVLTAGGRSTDPSDPFFTAIEALGGRVVRHGVPAHPGSMLWLARVGRTAILGLPTCGAYSKATAADLLLPRLLTGEPPTLRTVSHLGHGGVLTREMRFRFPPYARGLDAPDG